ncbi:MAG: hypothetical protein IJO71_12525 [Microbacterium sp.]|uniref:hypothetical protein n=1 Tax=Microbacterium sp. TaxID=51671 RepID=UPI0025F064AC|nr:hypothetical protein [Microbacterium sp.]MBQ9918008.1 hypothetical protein [Microbacterium sp.]
MPYTRHPRWARWILYVLRAALYALALSMGVGAVWFTPVTVSERMPAMLTDVWGAIALVGGVLCIGGSLAQRYRFELTGLPLLVGATIIYAATIWDIFREQDTRLAQASAVSALFVSWSIRWVDLLVIRWRLVREHRTGSPG